MTGFHMTAQRPSTTQREELRNQRSWATTTEEGRRMQKSDLTAFDVVTREEGEDEANEAHYLS